MEHANENQSLPRKAPRLIYPPVTQKKLPKPKKGAEYHAMEQKITNAIADFKAEKYPSLAEAGRANGITERAQYFRLRARAAGRASKSDRIKNGSQRLSPEQEIILCQFIDGLDDTHALHCKIGEKAYEMLCEGRSPDNPRPRPLGKQWPARFLERHPGILARQPKPLTSPTVEDLGERTTFSAQRPLTGQDANREPQLLTDCQQLLDRSASTTETCSDSAPPSGIHDASALTGEISSVEANTYDQRPLNQPEIDRSVKDCFFSAIKTSLAEHRMTFLDRRA